MANTNLTSMSVDALLKLRDDRTSAPTAVSRSAGIYRHIDVPARLRISARPGGGHKQVWLPAFAGKPCAVAGGHELRRDSALSISFSNALMSASHMFGPQVRTFLLAVVKALY